MQLLSIDRDQFVRSVNRVEPSLIRVEADEVTYGLHIILRFNLETRLVTGDLPVVGPARGLVRRVAAPARSVPERDADGVLQDIHWSMGSIGYFPTYAFGNLYAGQLRDAMERDLGDLERLIEAGDSRSCCGGCGSRSSRHGRVYPAGRALSSRHRLASRCRPVPEVPRGKVLRPLWSYSRLMLSALLVLRRLGLVGAAASRVTRRARRRRPDGRPDSTAKWVLICVYLSLPSSARRRIARPIGAGPPEQPHARRLRRHGGGRIRGLPLP